MPFKNFDEILNNIKRLTGARNQKEVAAALGISGSAITDAKNRNVIPETWFQIIEEKYGTAKEQLLNPTVMSKTRAMVKHEYGHEADQEEGTTPPLDMVSMTIEVLQSNTVYKSALASNIRAFHQAVKGEGEMNDLRKKVENTQNDNLVMRQHMVRLEERLQALEGVEPEKKRAGNDH